MSLLSRVTRLHRLQTLLPRSPWRYIPLAADISHPGDVWLRRRRTRHRGESLQAAEKRGRGSGHEEESCRVRFQPRETDCAGEQVDCLTDLSDNALKTRGMTTPPAALLMLRLAQPPHTQQQHICRSGTQGTPQTQHVYVFLSSLMPQVWVPALISLPELSRRGAVTGLRQDLRLRSVFLPGSYTRG